MRAEGLRGACRRRWIRTTVRRERTRPAPDLVNRTFTASSPNQHLVADITYIPTWEGFLFLVVVLDVFSRCIVGWAMASHMKTELALDALNMAGATFSSFSWSEKSRAGHSLHKTPSRKSSTESDQLHS